MIAMLTARPCAAMNNYAAVKKLKNLAFELDDSLTLEQIVAFIRRVESASKRAAEGARFQGMCVKVGGLFLSKTPSEGFFSDERTPEEDNVSSLNLSVRLSSCLRRSEITTISELEKKTAHELLQIRNFGESCLEELRRVLSAKGRRLADE